MAHTAHEELAEGDHLKRAFVPTRVELSALLITSFLLLLTLNVLPAIQSVASANYTMLTEYIREIIERLLAPTNNQQASVVLTAVFWMAIGIIVYLVIWVIASTYASYRGDVVHTKGMVLPASYNKHAAWHETLFRWCVRILATLMFLYWSYLFLASILPFTSQLFLASFSVMSAYSVVTAIGSVVLLAASLFAAIVLSRCIVLRERVFGP